MGVKGLWQLLLPTGRRISIETLAGKRLAIDASIWLTQFLKANRDPDTGKVRANAHLIGFLRRICRLLYHGIRPVFVFDGETPAIKLREIRARRERRDRLHSFRGDGDDDNEGVKRLARRLLIANLKKQKELEKAQEQIQNGNGTRVVKKGMKMEAIKNATLKHAKNTGAFAPGFILPEDEKEQVHEQEDENENENENGNDHDKASRCKKDDEVIELSDSEDYLKIAQDYHQPTKNNDWDNNAAAMAGQYSNDDDSEGSGSVVLYDEETLDVATLANLDSKTRIDIIEKARRNQRMDTRRSLVSVSANPDSYSQCQIKNFLKSATLNQKVNQLGKAVAAMKGEDGLVGERIASDGTRRFILTKDADGDAGTGAGSHAENGTTHGGLGLGRRLTPHSNKRQRNKNHDQDEDEDAKSKSERKRKRKRLRTRQRTAHTGTGGDDDSDSDEIFDEETEQVRLFGSASLDDESDDEAEAGGGGGGFLPPPEDMEHPKRQCITIIASSDDDDDDDDDESHSNTSSAAGGGGFIVSSSSNDPYNGVSLEKKQTQEILTIASSRDESSGESVNGADLHLDTPIQPDAVMNSNNESERMDLDRDDGGECDGTNECDSSISTGGGGFIAAPRSDEDDDSVGGGGGGGFIVQEESPNNDSGIMKQSLDVNVAESSINDNDEDGDIDWEDGEEDAKIEEVEVEVATLLSQRKHDGVMKTSTLQEYMDQSKDDREWKNSEMNIITSKRPLMTVASNGDSDNITAVEGGFVQVQEDSNGDFSPKQALTVAAGEGTNENSDDEDIDWQDGDEEEEDDENEEVATLTTHERKDPQNISNQNSEVEVIGWRAGKEDDKIEEVITLSEGRDEPVNASNVKSEIGEIDQENSEGNAEVKVTISSQSINGSTDASNHPEESEDKDGDFSNPKDVDKIGGKDVEMHNNEDGEKEQDSAVYDKNDGHSSILEQASNQGLRSDFIDTSLEALSAEAKMLRDDENRRERDMDTITDDMVEEVMQLLQFFGVPYLKAPAEAESQCAELERLGLVDGVVTEDSDAIVFGCKAVYRNCFDDKRFLEVYLSTDAEKIGLGHNEKIALAMLLGGDYTDGVKGVGIVNGMEILQTFSVARSVHDGLSAFRKWLDGFDLGDDNDEEDSVIRNFRKKHKSARTRWIAPQDFPSPNVLQAYAKPVVDSSNEHFTWDIPDIGNIRLLCSRKIGWEVSETDRTVMPVIDRMKNGIRQTRLDGYFMRAEDDIKFAEVKSKRLREVWNLGKNNESTQKPRKRDEGEADDI